MTGGQKRERGGVHDSQPVHTVNACLGVHDGGLVARLAHGARARRVEDGAEALADELQNLGVRGDVGAGKVLGAVQDRLHGFGGEKLSHALVARQGHGHVGRMGEPVGVDDGRIGRVGGRNVNCPSRQRRH